LKFKHSKELWQNFISLTLTIANNFYKLVIAFEQTHAVVGPMITETFCLEQNKFELFQIRRYMSREAQNTGQCNNSMRTTFYQHLVTAKTAPDILMSYNQKFSYQPFLP